VRGREGSHCVTPFETFPCQVPRSCDEVAWKGGEKGGDLGIVGLRGLVAVLKCGPGAEGTETWACSTGVLKMRAAIKPNPRLYSTGEDDSHLPPKRDGRGSPPPISS
jgi:hypothetical protein